MKNVVYMSDEEFSNYLDRCASAGLSEEEVSKIVERDCEAVCPEEEDLR